MEREMIQFVDMPQTMSSLEIAKLTGKPHNDVMKAIRAMEPAWEKVQGGKFWCVGSCIERQAGKFKKTD